MAAEHDEYNALPTKGAKSAWLKKNVDPAKRNTFMKYAGRNKAADPRHQRAAELVDVATSDSTKPVIVRHANTTGVPGERATSRRRKTELEVPPPMLPGVLQGTEVKDVTLISGDQAGVMQVDLTRPSAASRHDPNSPTGGRILAEDTPRTARTRRGLGATAEQTSMHANRVNRAEAVLKKAQDIPDPVMPEQLANLASGVQQSVSFYKENPGVASDPNKAMRAVQEAAREEHRGMLDDPFHQDYTRESVSGYAQQAQDKAAQVERARRELASSKVSVAREARGSMDSTHTVRPAGRAPGQEPDNWLSHQEWSEPSGARHHHIPENELPEDPLADTRMMRSIPPRPQDRRLKAIEHLALGIAAGGGAGGARHIEDAARAMGAHPSGFDMLARDNAPAPQQLGGLPVHQLSSGPNTSDNGSSQHQDAVASLLALRHDPAAADARLHAHVAGAIGLHPMMSGLLRDPHKLAETAQEEGVSLPENPSFPQIAAGARQQFQKSNNPDTRRMTDVIGVTTRAYKEQQAAEAASKPADPLTGRVDAIARGVYGGIADTIQQRAGTSLHTSVTLHPSSVVDVAQVTGEQATAAAVAAARRRRPAAVAPTVESESAAAARTARAQVTQARIDESTASLAKDPGMMGTAPGPDMNETFRHHIQVAPRSRRK